MDEASLVERCRRGDGLAWEALVRRHQGRVYGVALHYLREADEARDLAQEVFVRIYERMSMFQGTEGIERWLLRVTRNACIDRLRRRRARPPLSDLVVEDGIEPADPGPDPEREALLASRKRLLYRALDSMSEHHREMILLKEIHGLKLEEIAGLLALPLGTVKSRSNRARLELAEKVQLLQPSYGGA